MFVRTINVVVLYVGFCITDFVSCQYLHAKFVLDLVSRGGSQNWSQFRNTDMHLERK